LSLVALIGMGFEGISAGRESERTNDAVMALAANKA
jgi:hypothetical protein